VPTRDDPAARVVDPRVDSVPVRKRPDRHEEHKYEHDAHLHHLLQRRTPCGATAFPSGRDLVTRRQHRAPARGGGRAIESGPDVLVQLENIGRGMRLDRAVEVARPANALVVPVGHPRARQR
jgi:hypothetical protein